MANQSIAQRTGEISRFVLEEERIVRIPRSHIQKLLKDRAKLQHLRIYLALQDALAESKVIHAQTFCRKNGIMPITLNKLLKLFAAKGYLEFEESNSTQRRYIVWFKS